MAATVLEPATLKTAQWLMDHGTGAGMTVSCYADLSLTGERSAWKPHFNRELREIESGMGDNPDAKRELERNVNAVLGVLGGRAARRGRALAVFASVAHGFVRTFVLDSPVANRLVVDEAPYILPLLEYLHRRRRYLIVHTDSHHGRVYTGGRGPLHLIAEVIELVPRRQRASGERWGKQQATIARHREDHLLHFRKSLVREIGRAWPEDRYQGLILLGEHVVLAHLREALPKHIAAKIAFEGPLAFIGGTRRLERLVARVMHDAIEEHDRRVIDDVRTRVGRRQTVAKGPIAVLDAFRNGQVNWPGYVVMASDRGASGRKCPRCGSIFEAQNGPCLFCKTPCQTVNLAQEIALVAARHDIAVHFVGPEADLDRHGGVIAVLSRQTPAPAPLPETMATS